MKKHWRLWLWLLPAVLLVSMAAGYTCKQKEAQRFVRKLGAGISLANSLDVTGVIQYETNPMAGLYETYWHNPRISREQLKAVRAAGFRTVRLPVTWEEHMTEEGVVNSVWMDRVEELVRAAVDQGLYVILDTHYESWIIPSPEEEAESTRRLCTLWGQIAERFREYDEHLLFESMNEPRADGLEAQNIAVLNRMNAAFVETVRSSGGKNEERYLLLPTYRNSCESEAAEGMVLPDDKRLIVAVHFFIPYSFTLDQRGTTKWDYDSEADREEINEALKVLEKAFLDKGIPVMMTEMGCVYRGNKKEREAWASYLTRTAKARGIGCIWWDDGGKCRLLDREKGSWIWPELVSILTEG